MARVSTDPNAQARQLALTIVRRLRDQGFVAYWAGGCVRDHLLGLSPEDYDVATDAHPKSVRKLFRGSRYVGEAFGVALVQRGKISIEIATFRSEWGYQDGRRPTEVCFTDVQQDAQRRDFTINGLFEDPLARGTAKRIIDYVGGTSDLKHKIIRAIGEPKERFAEDYLRMLRAVRFAAALDFKLDRRTAAAIRQHSSQVSAISRERIGHEIRRMLTGPRPEKAARLIQRLHLDAPTLEEPHRDMTLPALRRIGTNATFATALAAWAIDRHAPTERASLPILDSTQQSSIVSRWRRALCLSNERRDDLRQLLKHLPRALTWDAQTTAQRKRLLAQPIWPQLWLLAQALARRRGVTGLLKRIADDAGALQAQGVSPQPLVTGEDLITAGYKPGPAFGRLLKTAYDVQLEGQLRNKAHALKWVRQQMRRSGSDISGSAQ